MCVCVSVGRACVRVLCCGPPPGGAPRVPCCPDEARLSQQLHRASEPVASVPETAAAECVPVHMHPLACLGLPERVSSRNLSVHSAACASSCCSGRSAWLPMPCLSLLPGCLLCFCALVCVNVCVCVFTHPAVGSWRLPSRSWHIPCMSRLPVVANRGCWWLVHSEGHGLHPACVCLRVYGSGSLEAVLP